MFGLSKTSPCTINDKNIQNWYRTSNIDKKISDQEKESLTSILTNKVTRDLILFDSYTCGLDELQKKFPEITETNVNAICNSIDEAIQKSDTISILDEDLKKIKLVEHISPKKSVFLSAPREEYHYEIKCAKNVTIYIQQINVFNQSQLNIEVYKDKYYRNSDEATIKTVYKHFKADFENLKGNTAAKMQYGSGENIILKRGFQKM
ncbi:MAG: hypothetical protein ABIH39_05300 [Candidatus Margulisiibacteriota bacterium]